MQGTACQEPKRQVLRGWAAQGRHTDVQASFAGDSSGRATDVESMRPQPNCPDHQVNKASSCAYPQARGECNIVVATPDASKPFVVYPYPMDVMSQGFSNRVSMGEAYPSAESNSSPQTAACWRLSEAWGPLLSAADCGRCSKPLPPVPCVLACLGGDLLGLPCWSPDLCS